MTADPKTTTVQATNLLSWSEWSARLLIAAGADGMGGINPEDYRNWYEAGEDPDDTWAEDSSYG